jgi:Domain of unknown function (DUF397)
MQQHLHDATWRKSTYSGDTSCVEFSPVADGTVALRDSKNPDADALVFTRNEIDAFLRGAKAGEFDDLA